ncbi:MAG: MBL fold metallo-hydrolase, partial [Lachnospiraceae bacterium]|nr:MBL fold metallo-hydrolase [Lachnospiraceae bacterium]
MHNMNVSEHILYVGADDTTLDLFESQYPVPEGVSYNSYVILDEKIAVMDTVDARGSETWRESLAKVLGGRTPDYLVVQHLEPDHSANIAYLAERYPAMQLVGTAKTKQMIPQFFDEDLSGRFLVVGEGDTLSLGSHTLQFVMAPMIHWPEVMMTYEQSEKVF